MTRTDELQALIDGDPINDRLHRQLVELVARWRLEDAKPNGGAAIIRQWTTDRDYFLATLAQLEPLDIYQMASAAVAHCAARVPWAPITIDQMLVTWQAAAAA